MDAAVVLVEHSGGARMHVRRRKEFSSYTSTRNLLPEGKNCRGTKQAFETDSRGYQIGKIMKGRRA